MTIIMMVTVPAQVTPVKTILLVRGGFGALLRSFRGNSFAVYVRFSKRLYRASSHLVCLRASLMAASSDPFGNNGPCQGHLLLRARRITKVVDSQFRPTGAVSASKASTNDRDTCNLRLQLKAMLAMSKVAPDELRALIQDTAKEAAVDQDQDVEPPSDSDEAASSVGSATDHDGDDDMGTDDDGNEGEGNCAGAVNTGTDGFTTVKRKRGSRRSKDASKSSKSSNSSYVESKKKCTESAVNQDQDRAPRPSSQTSAQVNLNVYVKGVDFDISKHVVKHPIAFKRSLCRVFGDVAEVKLLNGCLRVMCKNEQQRQLLLAAIFNSFESFRGTFFVCEFYVRLARDF